MAALIVLLAMPITMGRKGSMVRQVREGLAGGRLCRLQARQAWMIYIKSILLSSYGTIIGNMYRLIEESQPI